MAIYAQPNSWQCGPFALKHALLAVGRFAHEDDLARIAGADATRGTDDIGLARAARAHGCALHMVRRSDQDAAQHVLTRILSRGVPALLCLDQWDHWVAAVGVERDRFVVFDSHFDQPLRVEPWERLGDRLAYREERWLGTRTLYDVHPLEPRSRRRFRLALTPGLAERLLTAGDGSLSRDWDDLARELLVLGAPPGPQLEFGDSLAEWVARRRERIAVAVALMAPNLELDHVDRTLDDLEFVARLYGVILRTDAEGDAERRLVAVAATRAAQRAGALARWKVEGSNVEG